MTWKDILKEELTMEAVVSMLESKGLTLIKEDVDNVVFDGVETRTKYFKPKDNSIGEKLYNDHFYYLMVRNITNGIEFIVPNANRLAGRRVYSESPSRVKTRTMEHAEEMAELYLKRHKEAEKTFHSTPNSYDPRYR